MTNSAIIVAAGQGTRMGGQVSKPYLPLGGVSILDRTLRVFIASRMFADIILVVTETDVEYCQRLCLEAFGTKQTIRVIAGGDHRQESVYNGLEACQGQDDDVVLIHDGVRPFVTQALLSHCLETVIDHAACIAAVPACDTLKQVGPDGRITQTLHRDAVWLAQTPQGFRLDLIRSAHRQARKEGFLGTDDAQLVERLGGKVAIVPGLTTNIKITTPDDLRLAEAIWRQGGHSAESIGGDGSF
jgi:2-C-methyl-D-erythritol 4-phosphate cytidylyltransferase